MDGTTGLKDASVKQDPSKVAEGTSKGIPETFTKEARDKAVSDALAAAGRTAKALESREKAIQAREQAIKDTESKKDAAELEAAKDDPEQLTLIQRKQQLRLDQIALKQEREQLEQERAEHKAEIDAASETKFEIEVWEIAAKHGVDAVWLKGLGISDIKQLDLIAKGASTQKGIVPDSGRTIGGTTFNRDKKNPDETLTQGFRQLKK